LIYKTSGLILVNPELNFAIRDHVFDELVCDVQSDPGEVSERFNVVEIERTEPKIVEHIARRRTVHRHKVIHVPHI
jgi:hypothetical protein